MEAVLRVNYMSVGVRICLIHWELHAREGPIAAYGILREHVLALVEAVGFGRFIW